MTLDWSAYRIVPVWVEVMGYVICNLSFDIVVFHNPGVDHV